MLSVNSTDPFWNIVLANGEDQVTVHESKGAKDELRACFYLLTASPADTGRLCSESVLLRIRPLGTWFLNQWLSRAEHHDDS